MQIETGSPDLTIKVKRCAASGKTVLIDMLITNNSEGDVEAMMHWTNCVSDVYYDSEGNVYGDGFEEVSQVKIGNKPFAAGRVDVKLVSGVPVKVQVRVTGVSSEAEAFAKIDFPFWADDLGLDCHHKISLRNVPITRQ